MNLKEYIKKIIKEEINNLDKTIYHGGIISEFNDLQDFLDTYEFDINDKEQIYSFIKSEMSSKHQEGFYWFSNNINVAEYFSNLKCEESGMGVKFIAMCKSKTKNTLEISNNQLHKLADKHNVNHLSELAPILANKTSYDSWETEMRADGDLYNDICIFNANLFDIEKILFQDKDGNYSIEI